MTDAAASRPIAAYLEGLFGLDGRTAVISGGTSGLGAAAAEGLAQAGATVIVIGRDEPRGTEVVERIRAKGGQAELHLADVTDEGEVRRVADAVLAAHPVVDTLLNAAGIDTGGGPAADVSIDDWREVFEVNVFSTVRMCQAFGRPMLERGEGWVVNFASTDGMVGVPEAAAYGSSKGAVIQLTRSLAVEWIKSGVHVNAVAPTEFATPMVGALLEREEYREWVEQVIPAGRVGEPHELVGALLFLVSRGASMVVGHTLLVDGGRTAI